MIEALIARLLVKHLSKAEVLRMPKGAEKHLKKLLVIRIFGRRFDFDGVLRAADEP